MKSKLRYWILIADLVWITTVFVLAHWRRYGFIGLGAEPSQALLLYLSGVGASLSVWTLLYFSKNLDGFSGGWHLPTILSQAIVAAFHLMAFWVSLAFLTHFYFPKLALVYLGLLLALGAIAILCVARWLVLSRSRPGAPRRVVILGSGHIVRELALKIARHPEMSMGVEGVLFPTDTEPSSRVSALPVGTISIRTLNILGLMQEKKVQELIVVEPPPGPETEKLISSCRQAGMRLHVVPTL